MKTNQKTNPKRLCVQIDTRKISLRRSRSFDNYIRKTLSEALADKIEKTV
jgi:hypothetical protein